MQQRTSPVTTKYYVTHNDHKQEIKITVYLKLDLALIKKTHTNQQIYSLIKHAHLKKMVIFPNVEEVQSRRGVSL